MATAEQERQITAEVIAERVAWESPIALDLQVVDEVLHDRHESVFTIQTSSGRHITVLVRCGDEEESDSEDDDGA